MSALRFYPADEVEAALDYPALIAALREAFDGGTTAPLRHVHRVSAAEDGRLLLMPAWREGGEIGVKLVTVFPRNRERGLSTAELAELVSRRHPGRTQPGAVTAFKSVGAAVEDLCAARLVVARSGAVS